MSEETHAAQAFVHSLGGEPLATPEIEGDKEGEGKPADSQPEKKPAKSDKKKSEDNEEDEDEEVESEEGESEEGEESDDDEDKEDEEEDEEEDKEKKEKKPKQKKAKPFHKNKRWKQRETRHKQRITSKDEEIATLKAQLADKGSEKELTDADIPDWFNGELPEYKAYKKAQQQEIDSAVEKATGGKSKASQDKAVREATEWLDEEIERLEDDDDLNPDGIEIDRERLLEIVQDNDLVDSKNRWNYAAAFKILKKEEKAAKPKRNNTKRKDLAAATVKKDATKTKKQSRLKNREAFTGEDRPW